MYICNGYDIMRQEMLILIHLHTQTQHSIDTGSYIMDKHNIELKIKYRRLSEEEHINGENKQTNK
jgi:hypothetical protein